MDLNWLLDFECLARTQNFTRASNERNITQSAFSRRIKALEGWVGLPLVNRDTYPVQLTEAGQQFLPIAVEVVGQLSESRRAIRDADRGDRAFVRLSALHTISVNYLAPRIENMQQETDRLRTRVISDSLGTCCDLLAAGAVDILLCYNHHAVAPKIDEETFQRKDLASDPLIPVAATEAAHAHRWNLNDSHDAPIPYLAYESLSYLGMVVESMIGKRTLNAETIYVDSLVETIKRRLLRGSGFAWLPQTAVSDEIRSGRLVTIGDAEWSTTLTISAFANPNVLDVTAREIWDRL
ncbi:MAG: LysR family transcriptional regulator [Boseongicola sp.]|nr:LysR family transcriptional regulator [Boseongicola sp.]